jgi:glycosyltransferase involved in cell wall biosynthesis
LKTDHYLNPNKRRLSEVTSIQITRAGNGIQVSVVVPVRDEEDSIRDLLNGLLKQTFAPSEILVTDGGSRDATISIIEEFIKGGAPIKLFRERDSLPGHARNVGAAQASCEWIAFIDAGTIPQADWLESLVARVKNDPAVDAVYGAFEPTTDTFFRECAVITYLPPPTEVEGRFIPARSIATALMRRKAWETVGGFPEDLRSAEDLVFMQRVTEHGFREVRAPQAVVSWSIQPNLRRTFKRFVVYARNNIRAGLWRDWQRAIFQRYAVLALLCLPAFILGARWLLVVLICWLLLLMARAAKAIRKYRFVAPASLARNVARVLVIVPIIATLDLAAFIGSLHWLLADKLRLMGARL